MKLLRYIFQNEEELERKGQIYSLQYFRFKKTHPSLQGYRYLDRQRIPELLRTKRKLREISQREISLAAETGKAPPERRAKIREEEENLKAEYLIANLTRQQIRAAFRKGELLRGFDLWRSHPRWYLHKNLIQVCTDRGECCGRECGCCRNRNLPSNRQSAVGHCTNECLCCQNSRGFALTDETKKSIVELFPLNPFSNYYYYRKIMLASIYGIATDSKENPFNLIDIPPEYEAEGSTKSKVVD